MDKNIIQKIILENQELVEQVELVDSVKQPMAYNRISNLVGSTGVKTNT